MNQISGRYTADAGLTFYGDHVNGNSPLSAWPSITHRSGVRSERIRRVWSNFRKKNNSLWRPLFNSLAQGLATAGMQAYA